MFFGDGYEHFAWNDSDDAGSLFLDVLRPLRRPAADVNRAMLRAIAASPFLRDQAPPRGLGGRFQRLAR